LLEMNKSKRKTKYEEKRLKGQAKRGRAPGRKGSEFPMQRGKNKNKPEK